MKPAEYHNFLLDLKKRIREAQQRAAMSVNAELLGLYWHLGAEITRLQKDSSWGDSFLENLAIDLLLEFPGVKGFSVSNLKYIRRWYQLYAPWLNFAAKGPANWAPAGAQLQITDNQVVILNFEKPSSGFSEMESSNWAPVGAQLQTNDNQGFTLRSSDLINVPWSHHKVIIDKVKAPAELAFYLRMTVENGWSRNILRAKIESNLFARQGNVLSNFKRTLPAPDSDLALQSLKNPYNFDFLTLGPEARERDLENALVKHLSKFLCELGRGFTYVGRQPYFTIDGDTYFPDLVFFHTRLKRYIVFELKLGSFKPEYAGKLGFYCEVINKRLKEPEYEPTIGVLLCKTPNKMVIEYALKASSHPLGVSDYEIGLALPDNIKGLMPTIDEIEQEVNQASDEILATMPEWKRRLINLKNRATNMENVVYSRNNVPRLLLRQDVELLVKQMWDVYENFNSLFLSTVFTLQYQSTAFSLNSGSLSDTIKSIPDFEVTNIKNLKLHYSGYKTLLKSNASNTEEIGFEFLETNYAIKYKQTEIRKPYHHRIAEDEANFLVDELASDLVQWIEKLNQMDSL